MECSKCGAANPANAKFCGDCGHVMASARNTAPEAGKSGGTSWDSVFKWIGICVVGLFVLGLLAGM